MYQNPRPKVELLTRHYTENEEASGSIYHDVSPDSSHNKKQNARIAFYKKYFGEINKGSLLEIGCSTGGFLLNLDLGGWDLVGLEPSIKATSQARANGLEVICASLEQSDLPGKSYDAICCFSALEHFHDINIALDTMTRLLKPGGGLCVEVPDTMKPTPQIAEFFTFEHMSHFTKDTLALFLKGYGFDDIVFDDTVSDARLRIFTRKDGAVKPLCKAGIAAIDKNIMGVARQKLISEINKYTKGKRDIEKHIKERLASVILRWNRQGKKVAIYGAGAHTRYLLNLFDLSENVNAILDSDPKKHGKHFLRWTIFDESLLGSGQIDAVIISSKAFEDEIYERISKYSITQGVEIVRCYAQ